MTSISMPPAFGRNPRRSGAGEASNFTCRHFSQRWSEQANFPYSGLLEEQIDQHAFRPSAARQLLRQAQVPGIDACRVIAGELGCSPERRVQFFRLYGGGSLSHGDARKYCIYEQYSITA